MEIISPIPESLVNELRDVYPDRCPELGMADCEVWFRAGQASVIRFLAEQAGGQVDRARTEGISGLTFR